MLSTFSGSARLKEELGAVIESKELALSGLQKGYLRSRWLDQAAHADVKYGRALKGYYVLRLTMVVGSITIPVLVVLSIYGQAVGGWAAAVRGLTVLAALLVSVCVAVEHLFDVGGSYRRYERVAGRLQAEGWRFLQLSGPYSVYKSHSEAFPAFAGQVEALSQRDVEVYNFDVVHERPSEPKAVGANDPKKLDGSPREGAGLMEAPLMMPNLAMSRPSHQRTQ